MKKLIILFFLVTPCLADDIAKVGMPTAATPTQPTATQPPAATQPPPATIPGSRTNAINFEDEIVEGMNKNPFDSITNMYKKDGRDQSRLYRKKENFDYELKLTLREMGLLQ